jgi:hypothetical protein
MWVGLYGGEQGLLVVVWKTLAQVPRFLHSLGKLFLLLIYEARACGEFVDEVVEVLGGHLVKRWLGEGGHWIIS